MVCAGQETVELLQKKTGGGCITVCSMSIQLYKILPYWLLINPQLLL